MLIRIACRLMLIASVGLPGPLLAADQLPREVPRSVTALWSGFDPSSEPLDVKVVRQWRQEGILYRYVTFPIGTFKDKPARMAAFYGFPQTAEPLPGLLHLHGGGQRAFLHEVERRGESRSGGE